MTRLRGTYRFEGLGGTAVRSPRGRRAAERIPVRDEMRREGMPPVQRLREMQLVRAAQHGDEAASAELVRRYRPLVRRKARSYYLLGGERDDIVQEGFIGLFKAIRDYDPTRESSFHSFAELCVTRQIISAVKSATRLKHTPLNGYLSLSRPAVADEEGERALSEILAVRDLSDPCELVIGAWEVESIRDGMADALSPFEADVLRLYTAGRSYAEIAERLDRHTKAVDNALQRVKRKMEEQIERCRVH